MGLVEIARFHDLTEAQAAAAALRASDILVMMQNEHAGQAAFHLASAFGGFRLWVPEEDADDARAFIAACRADVRPSPPTGGTPQTLATIGLTVLLGAAAGWLVPALRAKRPPAEED